MAIIIIPVIIFIVLFIVLIPIAIKADKEARKRRRLEYNEYLKSDAWKRKRYVVLKRDNWTCHYCGARATQVHHLKYAKYNIGKEPIKWLVSVCNNCHKSRHGYAPVDSIEPTEYEISEFN